MTKGRDFDNPLAKAVQLGTIGTKTQPRADQPPQKTQPEKQPTRQPASAPPALQQPAPGKQADKKQQTIYLPKDLTRTLKHHAVDLETDISSVVQTALEEYFDRLGIPH